MPSSSTDKTSSDVPPTRKRARPRHEADGGNRRWALRFSELPDIKHPNAELVRKLWKSQRDLWSSQSRSLMVLEDKNSLSLKILRVRYFHEEVETDSEFQEWTVTFQFEIINPATGVVESTPKALDSGKGTKITDVLQKVQIMIEPKNAIVSTFTRDDRFEWTRREGVPHDGVFEITRAFKMKCKIHMYMWLADLMHFSQVNGPLMHLYGLKSAPTYTSMSALVKGLWIYIQSQDLLEDGIIKCDAYLKQVFGCNEMRVTDLNSAIKEKCQTPNQIRVTHRIDPHKGKPGKHTCVDILTLLPDQRLKNLKELPGQEKIDKLDEEIQDLFADIKQNRARRHFCEGFLKDPLKTLHLLKDANKA